jgi:hypothetical protein
MTKKTKKIWMVLVLIAGFALILTSFLAYLPALF